MLSMLLSQAVVHILQPQMVTCYQTRNDGLLAVAHMRNMQLG